MSRSLPRSLAIARTLEAVRRIASARGVTRDSLAAIAAELQSLAGRPELFPPADFPPPAPGTGTATRYRLNPEGADDDVALYLNSLNPGKQTVPHDHTTWAAIAAIEGEELNRLYRRTDDGRDPAKARLALVREVTVRPGEPIAFLPDDIHSIHVTGSRPTLHFHLYGRPLESLTGRVAYDLGTGAVTNYNATQMAPSTPVTA